MGWRVWRRAGRIWGAHAARPCRRRVTSIEPLLDAPAKHTGVRVSACFRRVSAAGVFPAAAEQLFPQLVCFRRCRNTPAHALLRTGFAISGHILRSEHCILDAAEEEHVPIAALEPLSTIRIAIKHKQKKFLAQNCVHEFLRKEWVGGGTDDFSATARSRFNAFWLLGWWIILPYNFGVMVAIAIYPPLAAKYSRIYTKFFTNSGVPSQARRLSRDRSRARPSPHCLLRLWLTTFLPLRPSSTLVYP